MNPCRSLSIAPIAAGLCGRSSVGYGEAARASVLGSAPDAGAPRSAAPPAPGMGELVFAGAEDFFPIVIPRCSGRSPRPAARCDGRPGGRVGQQPAARWGLVVTGPARRAAPDGPISADRGHDLPRLGQVALGVDLCCINI